MRLEQRDGPVRGLVAEVIRWLVQGGPQDGLGVLVPFRGPAAVTGDQGTWDGMVSVGRDPTVDRAATDTEPDGDLGDGAAPVEFEQAQSATVGAQVVGGAQLTAETKALLGCQPHGVHGCPLLQDNHEETKGARMDISWGYPQSVAKSTKKARKSGSDRR